MQLMSLGKDPQDKRLWELSSDGDLWAHFCRVVQAKGIGSIKITWVKGHADLKHVEAGITTHKDMWGNHQADATADEATALYGTDMLKVASWYHDRARSHLAFMKKVSQHIVEAYLIHRQLIERLDKRHDEQVSSRSKFYNPLSYSDLVSCRKLKHHASVHNYQSFCNDNPRAKHIEAFLSGLDVSPITGDQRPISWVELYILYVVRGFEVLEVPDHIAYVQPTPDKLIRAFKNLCRAVVSRTLPCDDDALLFSPAKGTRDNLVGVGILGQVPSVMFNVHVTDDEHKAIAQALVNLSRKVTIKNCDAFLCNMRGFIPKVLALNGNSGWVSTVKCLSPPYSVGVLWTPAPVNQDVGSAKNVAFYKCKHCDRVEPSSCASCTYSDLDRTVKCGNRRCLKLSRSREWSCACEVVWFTCAQHAKHVACGSSLPSQSHEQATGRTVSSKSSNRVATKEAVTEYQSLLQDDLRRGRKRPNANPVITLGDSAGPPQRRPKLGVILSERFGTSSSSC